MIQHVSKISSSTVITTYIQRGEGLPLVFLHGFCEDSSVWSDFLTSFKTEHIICIDLPGFGKSASQKHCSIREMASMVNSVLEDIDISACILLGHSMGGYVALEFAKHHPEKLAGLCLFHSQPYADSETKKENRRKSIDFIKKNGAVYFVKQLIPKLFAPQFGSESSLTISKLVFTASQFQSEGIINGIQAMIDRNDNQAVLKKIDSPVLFIVGEEDTAIPNENSLSQLVSPDIASIHILKGVGHMGMFEAQQPCTNIVKGFISFVKNRNQGK